MKGLSVVYEDERLLAVDKPSGEAVIPGRGASETEPLIGRVSSYIGGKAYVVHRLDRGTSGLVLFAKDSRTHRELSLLFERKGIEKTYRALVEGVVEKDGQVRKRLRPFGSGRMGIDPRGKRSETAFRVEERLPAASLLSVFPRTGRRHQVRVHLYSIGHPVLGDTLYGRPRPVGGVSRLMLHAERLRFRLSGGPPRELHVPAPGDFAAILQEWRKREP